MPDSPPTFPGLNRKRHSSHLRADGADDRTEGIPGQNPERNPGTFRSRPGGNRPGRSEQQFHLRLTLPRTDSRRVSLAPGGKSCFLWCPSAGEAHKPRRKSPFPAAASLFAGGFPESSRKNRGERSPTSPAIPNGRRVRRRQRNRSATSASAPTLRQPYRFILRRSRTSFVSRDDTACSEAAFPRGKAAPAAPRGPVRAARSAGRRL